MIIKFVSEHLKTGPCVNHTLCNEGLKGRNCDCSVVMDLEAVSEAAGRKEVGLEMNRL